MTDSDTKIDAQKVKYNKTAEKPVEPVKEGYIFGGWYWEADFSGELVTQLEVGANGTLYAKWDIKNPTTTYLETLGANTAGVVKFFKDGRIVIWKDGTCYDIQGNIIR